MNVNPKLSLKNRWMSFFKTDNISLDLLSPPIKNIKKIIKRNTRANSFNSLNYNQTETLVNNSNPFLIGIPNFVSSSKITLKKNIFNNVKLNSRKKYIKAKTRNITVRPSTSNLGTKDFVLNKKKNIKINLTNNNRNSSIYKSNDFSVDNNKLLLTNNNSIKKAQLTISQINQNQIKIEQIFKSNKKHIEVNNRQKNKRKMRSNKIPNNTNFNSNLEISSDYDQLELFSDYDYQIPKKLQKIKKINQNTKSNLKQFDGIYIDQKTLSSIISENKQIKQKNEELVQKFDGIKNEFELIKKDNKTIKEELKEKTKFLKNIQLALDAFGQELYKLQNINKSYNVSNTIYNKNNNNIYIHNNTNTNINTKQNKRIQNIERSENNSSNNKHKNKEKKNIMFNTIDKDLLTNKNSLSVFNSTSNLKITQLPLNSIIKNNKNYNLDNNSSKILGNKETKDTGLTIPSRSGNEEKNTVSEKEESESFDFTNISLAENLNINEEKYKKAINKINYCSNQHTRNDTNAESNNDETNKRSLVLLPKKLNFVKEKKPNDFNEEFLKNLNQFSDSWRKEAEKMIKRTENKSISINNSKKD